MSLFHDFPTHSARIENSEGDAHSLASPYGITLIADVESITGQVIARTFQELSGTVITLAAEKTPCVQDFLDQTNLPMMLWPTLDMDSYLQNLAQTHGRVHTLVIPLTEFHTIQDHDTLIQTCLKHMQDNGMGRIIFTVSNNPLAQKSSRGQQTQKFTIVPIAHLVHTLAKQAGPFGITVNGVWGQYICDVQEAMPCEWIEHVCQKVPLQRFGLPKEIAQTCVFLASSSAAFMNGQVLQLNGGASSLLLSPLVQTTQEQASS
jgi:NAD(P)-dependent dehydrogenase (short-subunit alcohol dehydrogenase family)